MDISALSEEQQAKVSKAIQKSLESVSKELGFYVVRVQVPSFTNQAHSIITVETLPKEEK